MPIQSLDTKLVMIIDSNLGQHVTASAESWEWRAILVRISNTMMTAFGPGFKTSKIYLKQYMLRYNEGNLHNHETQGLGWTGAVYNNFMRPTCHKCRNILNSSQNVTTQILIKRIFVPH